MHSGAKLICCVALMKLIQSYKLTLNDNVKYYIDFDCDIKIRDFIQKFSTTEDFEDERFNFKNVCFIEILPKHIKSGIKIIQHIIRVGLFDTLRCPSENRRASFLNIKESFSLLQIFSLQFFSFPYHRGDWQLLRE